MSSRLRFLFHCDLDGSVAYTGRIALLRMQALSTSIEKIRSATRTITKSEWIALGRPHFLERKISWKTLQDNGMRPEFLYVLEDHKSAAPLLGPKQESEAFPDAPAKFLALKPSITAAKLLWKKLPSDVRKMSSLLVLRENRTNCWRQSEANPRRYGWTCRARPAKSKISDNPFVSDLGGLAQVWGLGSGEGQTAVQLGDPFDGDVYKAAPMPSPGLSSLPSYVVDYETAASTLKKSLNKSLKKSPYKQSSAVAGDAPEPSAPEAAKKAKLRLGIWS